MQATASKMQTFFGICRSQSNRPVAGRIVFAENRSLAGKDSFLAVIRSPEDLNGLERDSMVGIIQLGNHDLSSRVARELSCPLLFLPDLPAEISGKIALLDSSCGALFVSPDIGIFNRLMHRMCSHRRTNVKPSLMLPNSKILRIGRILTPEDPIPASDMESALICASSYEEEDTLYERYRDLAELSVGTPLTVTVSCPRSRSDKYLLYSQLRALFRSAVFGSFSLLIKGILTPGDQITVLTEIRKIHDRLRWENREFNSAIPIGILLDSPLLLYERFSSEMRFCCLDIDRLWDLITGYSPRTDREAIEIFTQTIRQALCNQSLPCTSIITNRTASLSTVSSLWRSEEITDCFVPASLRPEVYDELSKILSDS